MTMSLHDADPCRDLDIDPRSDRAQTLYRGIVAQDREVDAPTSRSPAGNRRRVVAAVVAAGAVVAGVVVVATYPSSPRASNVALGPAGYRVARQPGGAVQLAVKWSEVADPHALQVSLDQAGARVKLRVLELPDDTPWCAGVVQPYSGHLANNLVEYHLSGPSDGVLIRPQKFPAGVTLLLTVYLSGSGTPSVTPTGTPDNAGSASMAGYATEWAVGPVADCS